ncbi:MAG TPA: PaaI family thioesterase [Paracoccaceae bacterium]|nr:PaaI family thioesterase [Paracoccaceae bacterium]HMO71738.1 PaaI family thioesterase [Paracoccaceae bacterium]
MTDTDTRIRNSFGRQGLMDTLGARVERIAPGAVTLTAPIGPAVSQQHGAGHAGLTFALADSAAGYSALSLLPEGREVMTVEAKINLLAPATGERLIARGRVVRAGRRITVVTAEVAALADGQETAVALFQGTMIAVDPPD